MNIDGIFILFVSINIFCRNMLYTINTYMAMLYSKRRKNLGGGVKNAPTES